MKRSEREVIKEWLENIFKTWERTNDLSIKEFKLTQMNHDTPGALNVENGGILRINGGPAPAPVSNGGTLQGPEARDQDRLVRDTQITQTSSDNIHSSSYGKCIIVIQE